MPIEQIPLTPGQRFRKNVRAVLTVLTDAAVILLLVTSCPLGIATQLPPLWQGIIILFGVCWLTLRLYRWT